MRLTLKLKIRDTVSRFPRLYRFFRATYHASRVFKSIYASATLKSQSSMDPKLQVMKVIGALVPSKIEGVLSIHKRQLNVSKVTLDIIIPVFNRGDLAADLILELQRQIESVSNKLTVNLICADDCSEAPTSTILSELSKKLGFKYFKQDKNLGFVGNVNSAWDVCNSEYVLLLNSDVVVTDGYLDRLLDPMIHDSSVGLSTNPTFKMFASRMQPGLNLRALNEYLLNTSSNQVTYVDACTAVGYSLVVRRSSVLGKNLLDPEFGRGYGEDSDLHYRIIDSGYRSVWNLDNVVSHVGGASFDMTNSFDMDRSSGMKVFYGKWGRRYLAEAETYSLALEEAIDKRVAGYLLEDDVETWVVLPSVKGNVGGLLVGSELAIEKSRIDSRTRVVTLDYSEGSIIGDFMSVGSISELFDKKASGAVILVGAQSLQLLKDKKWKNPALKFTYFCQGPDWLIDGSTLHLYRDLMPKITEVLSVSEYMDLEISRFSNKAQIKSYSPKFGYARYSGLAFQAKEVDFIFIYRLEFGKLGWLTTLMANFLSATHSVVVVSDHIPYGLSEKVLLINGLDRRAMLKQFSKARVYVDTSIFEGFGLTPREAALQNTNVLFMDVNDGRSELRKYPSHFSPFSFSPSIFEMASAALNALEKPKCPGCHFCLTESL
jgi:GT2 family glycosyltransferase